MKILSFLKRLFRLSRAPVGEYRTVSVAQSWTRAGIRADLIPAGFALTTSGVERYIRDVTMWEIASMNYAGLYVEPRFLEAVTAPPPEPTAYPAEIPLAPHVVELELGGAMVAYQHPGAVLRKVG